MLPHFETWMFYRGDGKEPKDEIAAVTVSAHQIKVVPVSQYISLCDTAGVEFLVITWPSTVKVRKIGR